MHYIIENCCVGAQHSYYRVVSTRQCICISFISHPAMYIQCKLSVGRFLFASLSSLSHWCTYKNDGPSRLLWRLTVGQWGDSCSCPGDQKLVWTGLLAGCGVLWLYHQLDSSRDCPWGLWKGLLIILDGLKWSYRSPELWGWDGFCMYLCSFPPWEPWTEWKRSSQNV